VTLRYKQSARVFINW